MFPKDPQKILGIPGDATEKQIKGAFRKLALRYHPDHNTSPEAAQRFQEISQAYEYLMKQQDLDPQNRAGTYEDALAREVLRREKARREAAVRARKTEKARQEAVFNQPAWHDPILIAKYLIHALGVLFAVAAITGPILLAVLGDPASLAGTFFFLVAGVVLSIYIFQHRQTWFRLGSLKTSWKDVARFLKPESRQGVSDRCCYCKGRVADGKPFRVEVLKTLEIRIRSRGALDHEAGYRNKKKAVVLPRSRKALLIHRISSLLKWVSILVCLLLFPVDSVLWRFIAGLFTGGILSGILLLLARVRSRNSYLLTPVLLLKMLIWVGALWAISETGPGFDIRISGWVYIVVAGLLFFLDMAIDLIFGFFPFYRWLFRPLFPQGNILNGLYRKDYQHYQELPVYSFFYPLMKWLF